MKLQAIQKTTRSQLRDGDVRWGGRLSEICQSMNKNIIQGILSKVSGHNITKPYHSAQSVNGAIGQRRFQCLPTEVSPTCGEVYFTASVSAMLQIIGEKSADVIVNHDENEEQHHEATHPKKITGQLNS